jgi:hypothetical protein
MSWLLHLNFRVAPSRFSGTITTLMRSLVLQQALQGFPGDDQQGFAACGSIAMLLSGLTAP